MAAHTWIFCIFGNGPTLESPFGHWKEEGKNILAQTGNDTKNVVFWEPRYGVDHQIYSN
jgi:hypothetical protein